MCLSDAYLQMPVLHHLKKILCGCAVEQEKDIGTYCRCLSSWPNHYHVLLWPLALFAVGIPAISLPSLSHMAPRVGHINCPTERRPGPVLDSQLVSFTTPEAFTAAELDPLTLVVHKPGNQLLRSDTHIHTEIFFLKIFL